MIKTFCKSDEMDFVIVLGVSTSLYTGALSAVGTNATAAFCEIQCNDRARAGVPFNASPFYRRASARQTSEADGNFSFASSLEKTRQRGEKNEWREGRTRVSAVCTIVELSGSRCGTNSTCVVCSNSP